MAPVGLDALRRAIEVAGGITRLANELGMKYQLLQGWTRDGREYATPAEYCPAIERLTGVRCEELRPDVEWSVLRGKAA